MTTTKLSFGSNRLINFSILVLHISGVWPKDSSVVYTISACLFHIVFTAGWTAAKCVGTVMLEIRSELILQGPTCIYCSMSVIRIFISMYNYKNIKKSFEDIINFPLSTEWELEYVRKRIKSFSRNSVAYVFFLFCSMTSCLITPIFEKERALPLPIWFPLDWESSITYYWIGYWYSFFGIIGVAVVDSFLPIFIWFLIYANALKLRLLGFRIAKIGYEIEERHANRDNPYWQLYKHIKVHKQISSEVNRIQEIFSITFLVQITSSAICICSVTYLMASENLTDNIINFIKYICLMGIYTYEIFMLMYFGNEVMLASAELSTSVYKSNWMDSSIKYRKMALILMERLKREEEMKIAKVFPLNLKMMSSILNVTYSGMNVLRSSEQGKLS